MNTVKKPGIAYILLFLAPALFTTNVIFGKVLVSVEPFTLAFLRWLFAGCILLAFCRADWLAMWRIFTKNPMLCLFCGFLAFWVCGGMVYLALHHTSATNGTLIYTTPPVLIIVIEAIWRNRQVSRREMTGVCVAIMGAFSIILHGEVSRLFSLEFNVGDLIFVAAAISWAVYSVMLKSSKFSTLSTTPLLALLALSGTLTLLPFAAYEITFKSSFPTSGFEWSVISGIVFFSSILAFLAFQQGVKVLGPAIAGIFMYLLPPWGLFFAWFFLDETLEAYHLGGTILIMAGIIIATFPRKRSSAG